MDLASAIYRPIRCSQPNYALIHIFITFEYFDVLSEVDGLGGFQ